MGTIKTPPPVQFFTSIIFSDSGILSQIEASLSVPIGPIEERRHLRLSLSPTITRPRWGSDLMRCFILFQPLFGRERLTDIKRTTNEIEQTLAIDGRRSVNIDPGYLALEHMVLGTTKGFAHRIYLGQGIFADLTLVYENGTYRGLPWTYPDYGSNELISPVQWMERSLQEDTTMPKSMTGFSRVEMENGEGKYAGEARSLNSRYLEISLKLPRAATALESRLREMVKRVIKRGRLDVTIKWDKGDEYASVPKANEDAVRWYVDLAEHLKQSFGLKGELTVSEIMSFKDIMIYEEKALPEEAFFSCFEMLLAKLDEERVREGGLIKEDLTRRLEHIWVNVEQIEKRWPEAIKNHEDMLRERILDISRTAVDETKILQEMGFYMERLDIAEEITRLEGTRAAFYGHPSVGGRDRSKARFIIQEMVRETNTIASKSNDLFISERAIQVKVEIEKMREQVQNVE